MKPRKDLRNRVLVLTVLSIALAGLMISKPWSVRDQMPSGQAIVDMVADFTGDPESELDPEFIAAVAALQSGHFARALEVFKRFQTRAPHLPEVHVNLGFTYLGMGQLALAEASFQQALQLRPGQANAYYGMALIHERRGDLDLARGAMRTFIHLADEADPYVRKANAALWEWGEPPQS